MAVANSSLFTLHSSLYFFAAQKYKKILTYRKKKGNFDFIEVTSSRKYKQKAIFICISHNLIVTLPPVSVASLLTLGHSNEFDDPRLTAALATFL